MKELIDQIELKDATKASKDKTESVKITLLNQELTRASLKPDFLSYFGEVSVLTKYKLINVLNFRFCTPYTDKMLNLNLKNFCKSSQKGLS